MSLTGGLGAAGHLSIGQGGVSGAYLALKLGEQPAWPRAAFAAGSSFDHRV